MSRGIKVPVRQAEKVKKELLSSRAFDRGKKVKRRRGFVIFPVKEVMKLGYEVVEEDFEELRRIKFQDYLREFLSEKQLEMMRRSFDIIGRIAIIEVPEEFAPHEKKIAESLAKAHKNIKGVFKKTGAVKGRERTRELVHLWGGVSTVTQHREHGCRYRLDVARVYFSPRLAYARQRILEQVKDGEVIVDLFAGVGPFSILLAKYRDVKLYAIDSNPVAYKYLKENILLNRVVDKVSPILGDCREVAPRRTADRVIMNLPKSSDEYLGLALDVVKKGVVHFYSISSEDDLYDSKIRFIQEVAEKKNRKVRVINKRVVRPYSPYNYHVVIDIEVGDFK
jgi:tRNA (guanine37-N1)-methyltransferase